MILKDEGLYAYTKKNIQFLNSQYRKKKRKRKCKFFACSTELGKDLVAYLKWYFQNFGYLPSEFSLQ